MHARTRIRFAVPAALVALVLAACGGGDGDDDAGGEATEPTEMMTSEPETTEPASEETTEPASEAASEATGGGEAAAALAGSYSGNWTNTTFGSTGDASFDVTVDGAAGTFEVTVDLGGGVFGEGDPDPFTFGGSFTADGTEVSGSSDVLGDFTFTMDADGNFSIDAPDVPSDRIETFTASGTASAGGITGTYMVTFPDGGGTAEGTFEVSSS